MKIYRLTIEPRSSLRTPLQSDTVFGHLLWALRYTEGEDALVAFLGRYQDGKPPPLLVSAGFPESTLPVPVLSLGKGASDKEEDPQPSLADGVVGGMLHHVLEEDRYLPLKQWQQMASRLSAKALKKACEEASDRLCSLRRSVKEYPVTRTAVDRITGSAREGQLFVTEEMFYGPDHRFDIWHKLADGADLPRLDHWWNWVAANGFGRRKSAGHGAFVIVGGGLVEADGALPQVENPNGFVTLSAWVPDKGDPTDVTYRTRVKRGKLAETFVSRNPWKKPLLMLEPGAVARLPAGKPVEPWYGRLVKDVHWTREGIVQYGYAFPLPVRIEEGA
jgi:CRISPR-associated protein Csm4